MLLHLTNTNEFIPASGLSPLQITHPAHTMHVELPPLSRFPPPSFHMPPVREVSDLNLCEAAKAAEAEAFAAAGV